MTKFPEDLYDYDEPENDKINAKSLLSLTCQKCDNDVMRLLEMSTDVDYVMYQNMKHAMQGIFITYTFECVRCKQQYTISSPNEGQVE